MDSATGDQYVVTSGEAWPEYGEQLRQDAHRYGSPRPPMRGAGPGPWIGNDPLVPQWGSAGMGGVNRGATLSNVPYTEPRLYSAGPQSAVAAYPLPSSVPVAPEPGLDYWERLYRWGQLGTPAHVIRGAAPVAAVAASSSMSTSTGWMLALAFMFIVMIFFCLICTRSISSISKKLTKRGGGSDCGCCGRGDSD